MLLAVLLGCHLLEAQRLVSGVGMWDGLLVLHWLRRECAGLLPEAVGRLAQHWVHLPLLLQRLLGVVGVVVLLDWQGA